VYLLESIISSEPYMASIDVNSSAPDTPICTMTSTHIFSAEDGSHSINWYFTQQDRDDVSPTKDFLALTIEVNLLDSATNESGREISYTRAVNLAAPPSDIRDDELNPLFISNKLLENGQTYSEIIELPAISISPETPFEQFLLSNLLLGRNVGLIQLSRDNGDVFTVVPE